MNIMYKYIFLNFVVISFINKEMVSLFQLCTYIGYVGMTSLQVKVHLGQGECFGLYRRALIIFKRE